MYKFHNEVRENSDEKNMGGVTKNDSVTSSFVLFQFYKKKERVGMREEGGK